MNITIKAKNIELTAPLESFINKKIGGLKKFLGSFQNHSLLITEGRNLFDTLVEIKRETMHHKKGNIFKAEAKIHLPGEKSKHSVQAGPGNSTQPRISQIETRGLGAVSRAHVGDRITPIAVAGGASGRTDLERVGCSRSEAGDRHRP